MLSLSVCIITKDEEHNIKDCLDKIAWANEIIIVDSESTDKTVEICRSYTDKILITPYRGCGPQKNLALDMATCDWVLMLDADERVTKELQLEIQATLQSPKYDAYSIPFKTYFCGKPLHFGNCLNERGLVLLKKDKTIITPRIVHSSIETKGTIGKLKNKILHYPFPTLEKIIHKMDVYSTYDAKQKLQQGKNAGLFAAISHGIFAFMRSYIFWLGFLDGREGFMFAVSCAEGSYYKYLKLYYLSKQ